MQATGGQKIGLLCFQGDLPRAVRDALTAEGRDIFTLGFSEFPTTFISDYTCSLGKVGRWSGALRNAGVEEIMLAGRLARPDIWKLRFDITGFKVICRLLSHFKTGDDALLRVVADEFRYLGFKIRGIKELCPSLTAPQGRFGRAVPDTGQLQAIRHGIHILRQTARLDIGQSVAVAGKVTIALEAIEGTDAMISRVADIASERLKALPKPILVKMRKAGQLETADLPTVGPETIDRLARAGFAGAALEAGGCLVIDLEETVRRANGAGLFLYGIARDEIS